MRDDGDNSHAGDYAERQVGQGEAFRPHHRLGQDAEHPQTGHVGQQMEDAAVQEHVGDERQPRGKYLPLADPQERGRIRHVRGDDADRPLPGVVAGESLADEGGHGNEAQNQRGGGRDAQGPADVLGEAVRTDQARRLGRVHVGAEVVQGTDPRVSLKSDPVSNWTGPPAEIALASKPRLTVTPVFADYRQGPE
jgi:hypothetical protein